MDEMGEKIKKIGRLKKKLVDNNLINNNQSVGNQTDTKESNIENDIIDLTFGSLNKKPIVKRIRVRIKKESVCEEIKIPDEKTTDEPILTDHIPKDPIPKTPKEPRVKKEPIPKTPKEPRVKKDQNLPPRYMKGMGRIDPTTLPIDENGNRCCRYCDGPITQKRRRTFCSETCVDEYLIRTDGNYLRKRVYQRDKGCCAICGIDTKVIARKLLELPIGSEEREKILTDHRISHTRKIKPRKNGGGLWDADHIIPVKDGGGQCGLENLRTLCISCHKLITFSK
jgi:5-methylcytosine-specific restriction protein A